jgi:hypothetical protein
MRLPGRGDLLGQRPGARAHPVDEQLVGVHHPIKLRGPISNKAVFSEPVFNSSAALDHLWEELVLTVGYDDDWGRAEQILREKAERASSSAGARRAITEMRRRYPVARTEVEPRVFVRATDNWIELSARFVVPVRRARAVKDQLTRQVLSRLAEGGSRWPRRHRT